MEITSPEEMQKFADDVRTQEQPFRDAAVWAFEAIFREEYKRLRAAGLEDGTNRAVLTVTARFNFDPANPVVELFSQPVATIHRPRSRKVEVTNNGARRV